MKQGKEEARRHKKHKARRRNSDDGTLAQDGEKE